jgi:hypothetical protein
MAAFSFLQRTWNSTADLSRAIDATCLLRVVASLMSGAELNLSGLGRRLDEGEAL